MRSLFIAFVQRYLDRHLPCSRSIRLNHKRVFIFPTRAGVCFLCLSISLLIVAINYENNLGYAFAFLLIGIFVVTILHTYRNLYGLVVEAQQVKPCFLGEVAEFRLKLKRSHNHNYFNLQFVWPDSDVVAVDLCDRDELRVCLYVQMRHRGWHKPCRLLVQTYYPLGILRAWTLLSLGLEALVYPKPIQTSSPPTLCASESEGTTAYKNANGSDDFHTLSNYQPGISPKRIAWKQYAGGQGLFIKQFDERVSNQFLLDWAQFSHDDIESRLSKLCYLAMLYHQTGQTYGLRLPGVSIKPDSGVVHYHQVLRALALYGL